MLTPEPAPWSCPTCGTKFAETPLFVTLANAPVVPFAPADRCNDCLLMWQRAERRRHFATHRYGEMP